MKIRFLIALLFTLGTIQLFSSFKAQETGQIYFIRSTNSEGSLIAYKVFIDDKLVCHLKNKHYSVHSLAPGEHTIAIQNAGLSSHKISRPLKITVQANKPSYAIAINGSELYLQETVESSAKELLKKVVVTKECLTAKDKK